MNLTQHNTILLQPPCVSKYKLAVLATSKYVAEYHGNQIICNNRKMVVVKLWREIERGQEERSSTHISLAECDTHLN